MVSGYKYKLEGNEIVFLTNDDVSLVREYENLIKKRPDNGQIRLMNHNSDIENVAEFIKTMINNDEG